MWLMWARVHERAHLRRDKALLMLHDVHHTPEGVILELVQVDDALPVALPVALRGPCRPLRGGWRPGAQVLGGDEPVLHVEAWPADPRLWYRVFSPSLSAVWALADVYKRRRDLVMWLLACAYTRIYWLRAALRGGLAPAPGTTRARADIFSWWIDW